MSSTPEEDMENADAIRANLGMDDVISTKAREIADALCLPHEDHKYPCPMADWIRTELEKAYAQGFSDCREKAAKVIHGEIEIYEEQAKRVNPTRLKKIQKRWYKLKEVENRIRAITPSEGGTK